MVENHPYGHEVTLWYGSANRDEAKFVDPWMFDVRRDPNPHFGYGEAACTSVSARTWPAGRSLRCSTSYTARSPDVAAKEEPEGLLLAFVNGIKRLPVAWTRRAELSSKAVHPQQSVLRRTHDEYRFDRWHGSGRRSG
jgi:cytochrome P450